MQGLVGCTDQSTLHALDLAIQNLKSPIPTSVWNMKMGFLSQIIQTGFPEKIVSGKTPDVFMVSEQDLSLLAARGVLEKVKMTI